MRYILIAILCLGLHVTNPSESDFIEFASAQIKTRLLEKHPDAAGLGKIISRTGPDTAGLENLISGFGNVIISAYLTEYTTQKDYLIFSVYEVDMKLARDFGVNEKNIKVLGIAGKFLPLEFE